MEKLVVCVGAGWSFSRPFFTTTENLNTVPIGYEWLPVTVAPILRRIFILQTNQTQNMNLHYITYLKVNTWGAYCNGVFTLVNAHLKRNAVKAFQKIDAMVQQGDVFKSGKKCAFPVVDKIVQVSATEFKYEIEL